MTDHRILERAIRSVSPAWLDRCADGLCPPEDLIELFEDAYRERYWELLAAQQTERLAEAIQKEMADARTKM